MRKKRKEPQKKVDPSQYNLDNVSGGYWGYGGGYGGGWGGGYGGGYGSWGGGWNSAGWNNW